MNFFEQQARAQQNSLYLYGLMALAVACLIFLSCMLLAVFFYAGEPNTAPVWQFWEILPTRVMLIVIIGIVFTISCASLFEYVKLRKGGAAVAEALGGQLIARTTTDFAEKRVLNIVEEMAIASGVPVPPVYVLNEIGINAFAAGHSIDNAAIGVTRSCITELTRDELQGVIAHEFSHIFHGDMTINMRLSALLFGILFVALVGEFLMRSSRYSSNSKNNAVPLIGFALFVLGYCGVFFANIIKASVSRQREFLADASAVQYTRNPNGIAGALNKIARNGSALAHPNAAQFSHMYFASGLINRFNGLFATHPPLDKRIQRIAPHFRANASATAAHATASVNSSIANFAGAAIASNDACEATPNSQTPSNAAQTAISSIGQPTPEHLVYAQALIAKLPDEINTALNDPYMAHGIVLGLFIDQSADHRTAQWQSLPDTLFKEQRDALKSSADAAHQLGKAYRLPLLELAMPSLKQLPTSLIEELLTAVEHFIQIDNTLTLDEWTLSSLLTLHLREPSQDRPQPATNDDIALVLSTVAQLGTTNTQRSHDAFASATQGINATLLARSALSFSQINDSLNKLNSLSMKHKLEFLKRVCVVITHDQRITYREAELLRLIAMRLGCPMPPLLIES